MPKLLTRTEYASYRKENGLLGGTYNTVAKKVREGKITCVDKLIDPDVADLEWNRNTDYQGQPKTETIRDQECALLESEEIPEFVLSKARIEATKAILIDLELQEKQGELVKVAEVNDHLFDVIVNLKQAILLIPQRIAPELTSLTDITDVENTLEGALTDALEQLSEQLSRGELLNKG